MGVICSKHDVSQMGGGQSKQNRIEKGEKAVEGDLEMNDKGLLSFENNEKVEKARGDTLETKGADFFQPIGRIVKSFQENETKSEIFKLYSTNDRDLHHRASFSDKTLMYETHENLYFNPLFDSMPIFANLGYSCKKGLKPQSPNQDSFFALNLSGRISIYGVFDGHGRRGHDVSDTVRQNIMKELTETAVIENPIQSLKKCFFSTQSLLRDLTTLGSLDALSSGSTCTVVIHDREIEKLYVAHVGDSRCVVGYRTDGGVKALEITRDHKADLPEERSRIEHNGGMVIKREFDAAHRVYVKDKTYPGLAMSRALGDLVAFTEAGVSAEPEVSTYDVRKTHKRNDFAATALTRPATFEDAIEDLTELENFRHKVLVNPFHLKAPYTDEYLLLCSDGVWEFINSDEAIHLLHQSMEESQDIQKSAERLAKESWDRWIQNEMGRVVDDITVLAVVL